MIVSSNTRNKTKQSAASVNGSRNSCNGPNGNGNSDEGTLPPSIPTAPRPLVARNSNNTTGATATASAIAASNRNDATGAASEETRCVAFGTAKMILYRGDETTIDEEGDVIDFEAGSPTTSVQRDKHEGKEVEIPGPMPEKSSAKQKNFDEKTIVIAVAQYDLVKNPRDTSYKTKKDEEDSIYYEKVSSSSQFIIMSEFKDSVGWKKPSGVSGGRFLCTGGRDGDGMASFSFKAATLTRVFDENGTQLHKLAKNKTTEIKQGYGLSFHNCYYTVHWFTVSPVNHKEEDIENLTIGTLQGTLDLLHVNYSTRAEEEELKVLLRQAIHEKNQQGQADTGEQEEEEAVE